MTKTPQSPRILVTGANGRLGRLLRAVWVKRAEAPLFAARQAPCDIHLDADHLPLPDLPACDTVVALWGVTSGDDAALARNIALADHSRAVARACGARRVLHLSSAAIYGPGADLTEDQFPANPVSLNAYGRSKWQMEQRIATFDDPGLTHCCLRLANVVGADSLAPALTAPPDHPVTLDRFADGRGPMRSYICPGDVVGVLDALAQLPPGGLPAAINIAAPDPVGMADLARAAGRDVVWRDAPAGAVQTVSLSTGRLTALLPGLTLRTSAPDMINDWTHAKGAA